MGAGRLLIHYRYSPLTTNPPDLTGSSAVGVVTKLEKEKERRSGAGKALQCHK